MMLEYSAALQSSLAPPPSTVRFVLPKILSSTSSSSNLTRRGALSTALISTTLGTLILTVSTPSKSAITEFLELPNSGGIKALDLRLGSGEVPSEGDQVAIHYYGRTKVGSKQRWRFDSTIRHMITKMKMTISGIETAMKSMKMVGLSRIVIPPSQGYQSMSQEPIPPNSFDRQTVYNDFQSNSSW